MDEADFRLKIWAIQLLFKVTHHWDNKSLFYEVTKATVSGDRKQQEVNNINVWCSDDVSTISWRDTLYEWQELKFLQQLEILVICTLKQLSFGFAYVTNAVPLSFPGSLCHFKHDLMKSSDCWNNKCYCTSRIKMKETSPNVNRLCLIFLMRLLLTTISTRGSGR